MKTLGISKFRRLTLGVGVLIAMLDARTPDTLAQSFFPTHTFAPAIVQDPYDNYYVAAYSTGSVLGRPKLGPSDLQLIKYDHELTPLASINLGSSVAGFTLQTSASGVAVGPSEVVSVSGTTGATLDETLWRPYGVNDAFVTRFTTVGGLTKSWTRQLGYLTNGGIFGNTFGAGTVIDVAGFVYLVGTTAGPIGNSVQTGTLDSFFARYDPNGNLVNFRQFGSPGQSVTVTSIVRDNAGWFYIAGYTSGALFGQPQVGVTSAFVSKFDCFGGDHWTKMLGTTATTTKGLALAMSPDGNSVYLSGVTNGNIGGQFSGGNGTDYFLAKFAAFDGTNLFTVQKGVSNVETVSTAVTTSADSVFVGGYTGGQISTSPKVGVIDSFIMAYNSAGVLLSSTQQGVVNRKTYGSGLAPAAPAGFVFSVGHTTGNLEGNLNLTSTSLFVSKYFSLNGPFNRIFTYLLGGV